MSEYERFTERVGKSIVIKETSTNDNKSIWNALERLAELEDKIEQGILVEQKHCNLKVIDHYELGRIFVCLNCGTGLKFPEGDIKSNNYSYCPICGSMIIEEKGVKNE